MSEPKQDEIQVCLRIPLSLRKQIDEHCAENEDSASQLIRRLLKLYFQLPSEEIKE